MGEVTTILYNELGRLLIDFNRCTDQNVKKQIQLDIQLLKRALLLCEQPI